MEPLWSLIVGIQLEGPVALDPNLQTLGSLNPNRFKVDGGFEVPHSQGFEKSHAAKTHTPPISGF